VRTEDRCDLLIPGDVAREREVSGTSIEALISRRLGRRGDREGRNRGEDEKQSYDDEN
jgi:hypothetical protein